MGLLSALLVIALIFYAFCMIVKLAFKRKMKKLERQMKAYDQDETPSTNNETRNPHVDPNIGEYTDFEEIG